MLQFKGLKFTHFFSPSLRPPCAFFLSLSCFLDFFVHTSQGVIVQKQFSPPAKQQQFTVCAVPEMNTSGLHIAVDLRLKNSMNLLYMFVRALQHCTLGTECPLLIQPTQHYIYKIKSFFMFSSNSSRLDAPLSTQLMLCGDIHTLPCGRFESC